jgi:hypothetical protein
MALDGLLQEPCNLGKTGQDSHGKWWENDLFIWGFNIDIDLTLISHGWYMMKAF